ncbi:MAG: hypothetical protein HYU41_09245 [Candidatus Rokubacteria bacterium]|nr:hypothetical protein [Candidatus Rokubacteria bacterium]
MNRTAASVVLVLVATWVVAHLLYLGPVEAATEMAVTWLTGFAASSMLIAAVTVLTWGLILGHTSPAWLRFVQQARTATAMLGVALVIFGLLHWRDTEPRSELHWVVVGVAVLAGAGLVHAWLMLTGRRRTA